MTEPQSYPASEFCFNHTPHFNYPPPNLLHNLRHPSLANDLSHIILLYSSSKDTKKTAWVTAAFLVLMVEYIECMPH